MNFVDFGTYPAAKLENRIKQLPKISCKTTYKSIKCPNNYHFTRYFNKKDRKSKQLPELFRRSIHTIVPPGSPEKDYDKIKALRLMPNAAGLIEVPSETNQNSFRYWSIHQTTNSKGKNRIFPVHSTGSPGFLCFTGKKLKKIFHQFQSSSHEDFWVYLQTLPAPSPAP